MLACWCRAVLCRTDNAVKCAGRGEAAGYEIPWTRDCEMAQCIAADAPITTDSPAPPSQASADLKACEDGGRLGRQAGESARTPTLSQRLRACAPVRLGP